MRGIFFGASRDSIRISTSPPMALFDVKRTICVHACSKPTSSSLYDTRPCNRERSSADRHRKSDGGSQPYRTTITLPRYIPLNARFTLLNASLSHSLRRASRLITLRFKCFTALLYRNGLHNFNYVLLHVSFDVLITKEITDC